MEYEDKPTKRWHRILKDFAYIRATSSHRSGIFSKLFHDDSQCPSPATLYGASLVNTVAGGDCTYRPIGQEHFRDQESEHSSLIAVKKMLVLYETYQYGQLPLSSDPYPQDPCTRLSSG